MALNGDTGNERPVQVLSNPLCANPGPELLDKSESLCHPRARERSAVWAATTSLARITSESIRRSPANFQFAKRYRLEVRAEAFNLTNSFRAGISLPALTAGASGVNTTFGTPTFGQITSALDPRILQMAMKFSF